MGFPSDSVVKSSSANAGDMGSILGSPLQYSCQEKSHRQRNTVGCNMWCCKRVKHNLVTKQLQQPCVYTHHVSIICLICDSLSVFLTFHDLDSFMEDWAVFYSHLGLYDVFFMISLRLCSTGKDTTEAMYPFSLYHTKETSFSMICYW